jgi:hypothetical protein
MVGKNTWTVSRNSARIWELSGGIGVCGQCGSRLKTHSTTNASKTKYFYYLCPKRTSNRDNGTCPNTKHYRAETLELLVKDTLVDTFWEESWIDFVNDTCDRQINDLRKMYRSDPLKTRERLSKRIDALEMKITRVKDLYVDGDISKEEYGERKTALEGNVAQVTDELSRLDDLDGAMKRIDHLRVALLSLQSPFSGHYVFTGVVDPEAVIEHGLSYGSRSTAARRRMEFYRGVGLCVKVGREMEISLDIAGSPVSKTDHSSDSTRSPTGTP